jgi:hypothetical protein
VEPSHFHQTHTNNTKRHTRRTIFEIVSLFSKRELMEKFISFVVVLGVAAAVLLQCAAAQTVHVVGDSSGWVVPQGGAATYQTWADNNEFVVGDILSKISLSLSLSLSMMHAYMY